MFRLNQPGLASDGPPCLEFDGIIALLIRRQRMDWWYASSGASDHGEPGTSGSDPGNPRLSPRGVCGDNPSGELYSECWWGSGGRVHKPRSVLLYVLPLPFSANNGVSKTLRKLIARAGSAGDECWCLGWVSDNNARPKARKGEGICGSQHALRKSRALTICRNSSQSATRPASRIRWTSNGRISELFVSHQPLSQARRPFRSIPTMERKPNRLDLDEHL